MTAQPHSLSRREALKRVIGVSIALSTLELSSFGAVPGIGTDPNLHKKDIPWPRVLSPEEKRIVTSMGDLIVPADEFGPAASAVGVPDFIDEWVSAPYEAQQKDGKVIRDGLAWIDAEAKKRFQKGFADCAAADQTAIFDDIVKDNTDAHKKAFSFFKLLRDRVTGGYYSTPEGWKAIGYVGNTPMVEFPGPPPEVLKHLGLA
ncbi:MAG TPA: gluconate 2-dehydrogenase subunit 3 family protein [Chthoniobacter sp.]|nr:gluconate 2-dehydrogenase subunit 3 family protein [Chthoniobacter sp.]